MFLQYYIGHYKCKILSYSSRLLYFLKPTSQAFMASVILLKKNMIRGTGTSHLNYKIQYKARHCIWSKRTNILFGFLTGLEKLRSFTQPTIISLFMTILKFISILQRLKHLELINYL